jgi:hypothetical protein
MAFKFTASPAAHQNGQHANEQMTEMTRAQMALTDDWLAQMFRTSESLQRTHQQFSERVALLHRQAAQNLRHAANPAELAFIQSNLMMSWMQDASRLCLDMMMVATKLGTRPGASGAQTEAVETATHAASVAMSAAVPMMQAWQLLFTAPMEAGPLMRY